jgi:hypothetical protein
MAGKGARIGTRKGDIKSTLACFQLSFHSGHSNTTSAIQNEQDKTEKILF